MSREIKFRVWSEEDREYRTDCRLKDLFVSETGTPATVYSDEGDRFDIEQYTGLKDKNGKEIYEGDIVDNGYSRRCEIKWSEHSTAFEATNEEDGYVSNVWFVAKYGEVIGNIHEDDMNKRADLKAFCDSIGGSFGDKLCYKDGKAIWAPIVMEEQDGK